MSRLRDETWSARRGAAEAILPVARVVCWARGDTALIVLLTFVLIAPFFVFETVPLYDLPNHIARQHVLFGDGAPGASLYYSAQWRLIPNLAMEGVVYALRPFVSVDFAVRVFLAATAAQLFLGAITLNRALFGGSGRFAIAACLFAYNGPFLFGFVNFAFGIGMALWVFALWLRRGRQAGTIPLFALLSGFILLAHLSAFAVYALVLGAYEVGEIWQARRQPRMARRLWNSIPKLAHLALPVVFYLAFMPRELSGTAIEYGGLASKVAAIVTMIGTGNPVYELACLAILAAGAVLIAGRVVVAPAMILPLAALGATFVALPHRLGEAFFVDYRMPSTILLFLVGSTRWHAASRSFQVRSEALVLVFFTARFATLMAHWAAWQPLYDEYRAAFAALPPQAKLLPLRHDPGIFDPREAPPLGQIAALAVTERGALIPNLFADMAHQILVYRPPFAALATQAPRADEAPAFDYVLVIRPEEFPPEAVQGSSVPRFLEIARGRTFVLGRLEHP
jgi:hypothetical protein